MSDWLKVSLEHKFKNFNLNIDFSMKKEVGVLFGPSGAGKSLTLRFLAGLDSPDKGKISIGGRTLLDPSGTNEKTHRRRIGMVFQDLALFPHLTAAENVSYGLSGNDRMKNAEEWLERIHLPGRGNSYPSQLSGGQRQRVALARAMAFKPDLLLLDEPFSALDGPLRRSLRRELKSLHRETGIPMLYVTHHIEDVCSLGDHIFFIRDGSITGNLPVEKLWDTGAQGNVWHALGWGNLLYGEVREKRGGLWFVWEGGAFELPPSIMTRGDVSAFIPPHFVKLIYPDLPVDPQLAPNILEGRISEKLTMGSMTRIYVETEKQHWHIEVPAESYRNNSFEEGDTIRISIRPRDITIMENMKEE